jgi:hypothetical protein
MVEFMRFGMRGDKEEAEAVGTAFPLAPLVAVRDMAELMAPSEAGVRVERGDECSCKAFGTLLGVDLLGVATGVVEGTTMVTDEGSWAIPALASADRLSQPIHSTLEPEGEGNGLDQKACP